MAVSAQTAADIRARAVRYRPLAISLVRREVRQRYKGSAFGLLWVFVAPIVAMIAYSVVFHYVFRIVEIEPETLRRIPKASAHWFAELARTGVLPA